MKYLKRNNTLVNIPVFNKGSLDIFSGLKKYCQRRLENYKVPGKVNVVREKQYDRRFKKGRLQQQ